MDPVQYYDHLVEEKGTGCFALFCCKCSVCPSVFALSFGANGRLYSVIFLNIFILF